MGVGRGQREIKGRKNWDNRNSIINKIYLKTEGGALKCAEQGHHTCSSPANEEKEWRVQFAPTQGRWKD